MLLKSPMPKYQSVVECLWVQNKLHSPLVMHSVINIMNSIKICVFVSLSTVERLSGAAVEFFISFVSCPV